MKSIILLTSIVIIVAFVTGCGNDKKNESEKEIKKEQTDSVATEEIAYEDFSVDKLQGTWKIIEAQAYSRDQLMGTTFIFEGDSATFTRTSAAGAEIAKGFVETDGKNLTIAVKKRDEKAKATVTVTESFTGGFNNEKLYLNSMDQKLELEKQ